MKIYVAGIPFKAEDDDLRELFEEYGNVVSSKIIIDRYTQKSRGFGFVEMDDDNAKKAIEALNGSTFMGKELMVNEARPQTENSFNNRSDNNNRRNFRSY